jgi:aminoglycoside phosphotransferase (APT) family kinase protein
MAFTLNAAIQPALERWFAARLGASAPVRVSEPVRIAVGHSRAMLAVEVEETDVTQGHQRAFVLRVEQGGVFGTNSGDEVRLMRKLRTAGYPVAPVRWYERDPNVIGAPFFVMDRIEGRGENPDIGSVRNYVALLAAQHDLDWQKLGLRFLGVPSTRRGATLAQIERWERIYLEARYLPVPLLDEAAAWLRAHAPTPERVVLVHGDPGPGNYMYAGDTINAVTDWEFAHLGDANEDWVYVASVRGQGRSRDEWRALFCEAAPIEISDSEWDYWDAFNQFKGACANLTALRLFSEGINPAPNMAAVGTSVHLLMLNRLADIIGKQ